MRWLDIKVFQPSDIMRIIDMGNFFKHYFFVFNSANGYKELQSPTPWSFGRQIFPIQTNKYFRLNTDIYRCSPNDRIFTSTVSFSVISYRL